MSRKYVYITLNNQTESTKKIKAEYFSFPTLIGIIYLPPKNLPVDCPTFFSA